MHELVKQGSHERVHARLEVQPKEDRGRRGFPVVPPVELACVVEEAACQWEGVAVMEEGLIFPLGEPTVGFAPTAWVVPLGKYPTDELALLGLALTVAAPVPLGPPSPRVVRSYTPMFSLEWKGPRKGKTVVKGRKKKEKGDMSCLLEGRKKLRRGDEEEWMRWIPDSRCLTCWPEERGWRRQGEWRAQEEALCGMIDYHGTRVFRNAQFTFAEFLAKIVREFGSSQQLQDTSPDIFLLLLLIAPRGRYICGFNIEGLVRGMVVSGIVHEHVKAREDRRHSPFELQRQGEMIPTHPGSRYMGAGEISKVKPPAGRGIGGLVDGDVQASFVRRIAFFEQNSTFGRGFHGGVTLVPLEGTGRKSRGGGGAKSERKTHEQQIVGQGDPGGRHTGRGIHSDALFGANSILRCIGSRGGAGRSSEMQHGEGNVG
ncbi:hypothetical protein B0H13DRAFT_1921233 [Mycena leptocephala]|nr:hypothetical protein B0H13DRAFT_1921233 [Mycena leptocephala]